VFPRAPGSGGGLPDGAQADPEQRGEQHVVADEHDRAAVQEEGADDRQQHGHADPDRQLAGPEHRDGEADGTHDQQHQSHRLEHVQPGRRLVGEAAVRGEVGLHERLDGRLGDVEHGQRCEDPDVAHQGQPARGAAVHGEDRRQAEDDEQVAGQCDAVHGLPQRIGGPRGLGAVHGQAHAEEAERGEHAAGHEREAGRSTVAARVVEVGEGGGQGVGDRSGHGGDDAAGPRPGSSDRRRDQGRPGDGSAEQGMRRRSCPGDTAV
jgi:hypothetical protein